MPIDLWSDCPSCLSVENKKQGADKLGLEEILWDYWETLTEEEKQMKHNVHCKHSTDPAEKEAVEQRDGPYKEAIRARLKYVGKIPK